ncbi:MAG: NADAR family protein [Candidatus Eremiobacteraeota bacterium]|nr:NADAR family protein [Candidatus Eremiobacteraeota bacterium]
MQDCDEREITEFVREYAFLSNHYALPIRFDDALWPTVEHAFQAQRTLDATERDTIRRADSPGKAKRLARGFAHRDDWDSVKEDVMLALLRIKFADPEMRMLMIETGDRGLVEGNRPGDAYWGRSGGVGCNRLGQLLMQVRDELRARCPR